ncbi:GNAT family N-acetyltransferase [Amycolatopsis sp.]|jgi:GNAT superfamily N-acetyltransferase|uniref:GNAT family N-acetyltransferase n=1 Tax=Amycolatopsis sp. TaxID=37632 RepID=UPI002DFFB283|nr:GNAT family N-acetyltransferase [Amycolatopsis sp.]
MEIRIAGDAAALAELNQLLYLEDAGTHDPFTDIEAALADAMNYFTGFLDDESTTAFLAVENGSVAGYLAGRFYAKSLRRKVSTAELESIYVRPEFRNRQVGALLVDSFFRWAVERGAGRAAVNAYFANESARRFYERFGFAPKNVTLDMAL